MVKSMADLEPFEDRSADHLRLVIETGRIGIWELDLRTGQAIRNAMHDKVFGYSEPLPEWTYDMFLDHVVQGDRERVDALQKDAVANRREWAFECRIVAGDGEMRWISAAGRPLTDADGNIVKLIGHVMDITPTKHNEERLRLITQELDHRVRNMLAMVRSMVRTSAPIAQNIPDFAEAIEGRVSAMARSHQMLVSKSTKSVGPSAILRAELSTFPELDERVTVTMENEPELTASTGQGLALVFHELLTNAIKYGALSNDTGQIAVRISGSERCVDIEWEESGGPRIDRELSSGFGSTLIAKAIAPDGSTRLTFPEDGAQCHIRLEI